MKKLEEIQSGKLMSAYGAVGSIIETKDNGSLMIDYFNRWSCFGPLRLQRGHVSEIDDPRLLRYLQNRNEDLEHLYRVPTPDLSDRVFTARENDLRETIKSHYFPGWFFCPKCRRLHRLNEWEELWRNEYNGDESFKKNPPSCPYCSNQVAAHRFNRRRLEQVRFLMASLDNGLAIDIPFDKIWNAQVEDKAFILDNAIAVPEELYYRTSPNSDGLQSIYIQRGIGGPRKYMSEINSRYLVYFNNNGQDIEKGAYKLVLRNQNNVYYPNTIKSIYIPTFAEQITSLILQLNGNGMLPAQILATVQAVHPNSGVSLADIEAVIRNDNLDMDSQEYVYITNPQNYNRRGSNKKKNFWAKRYPNLQVDFIKCIYSINQLKETSVVPSFTRIAPKGDSIQWYDINAHEENEQEPRNRSTHDSRRTIDYLPAVEAYGEGLFFDIDVSTIDSADRFVFVHTLSHMIMKELEFQCGYPVSLMKEKIYQMNGDNNFGILIYTIGGAEGSYGGFVSLLPLDTQSDDAKLLTILKSAMIRVHDCPNDPICKNEGGHCFACLDVPEISCSNWNKDLNRNIVIIYLNNNSVEQPALQVTATPNLKNQEIVESKSVEIIILDD